MAAMCGRGGFRGTYAMAVTEAEERLNMLAQLYQGEADGWDFFDT